MADTVYKARITLLNESGGGSKDTLIHRHRPIWSNSVMARHFRRSLMQAL